MRRRGFLGLLGSALAGATLDPERLLWRPGAKLISVPRIVTPLPATFLTMDDFCERYIKPALEKIALDWQRQLSGHLDSQICNGTTFASSELIDGMIGLHR